jgi:hypothetical protein
VLTDRRGEMDEAAFVFPILLLISLALINLAMLGFASITAGNAANFGARMGSVAQSNASSIAYQMAASRTEAAPFGSYQVSVSGSGQPGTRVLVRVAFQVPNFFARLAGFFGVPMSPEFSGSSEATFRQEGW